jgi:hypothetical protein
MPLRFGFGADAVGFGLAFRFLLVDPRFPRFAVGGVLAGEGNRGDVGVGDDPGLSIIRWRRRRRPGFTMTASGKNRSGTRAKAFSS